MQDAETIKRERRELDALLNKGVSFAVGDVEYRRRPGLAGRLLRRSDAVPVTREFVIKEPTLGTLDRIAGELIEIEAIESVTPGGGEPGKLSFEKLAADRETVFRHSRRAARIIALAVLGPAAEKPRKGRKGRPAWVADASRVDELAALFHRSVKPSQLFALLLAVAQMSNLQDFTSSIALMQIGRTTRPDAVE